MAPCHHFALNSPLHLTVFLNDMPAVVAEEVSGSGDDFPLVDTTVGSTESDVTVNDPVDIPNTAKTFDCLFLTSKEDREEICSNAQGSTDAPSAKNWLILPPSTTTISSLTSLQMVAGLVLNV